MSTINHQPDGANWASCSAGPLDPPKPENSRAYPWAAVVESKDLAPASRGTSPGDMTQISPTVLHNN